MATDEPRLARFEPASPPSTNGSHLKRRRRSIFRGGGIIFGVLVAALVGASMVGRVQWLNLANPAVSHWGRPVLAAALGGLTVGWWRRTDARAAAAGGALAALLALWLLYAMQRIGAPVVFIERSIARVITFDLLRLATYAVPAGAIGALVPPGIRLIVVRSRDRRSQSGR